MQKKVREFRKKIKRQLSWLTRRFVEPSFPQNSDGKVLLHIGCGEKNVPGFINLDARPWVHLHIAKDDVIALADLETGTVD